MLGVKIQCWTNKSCTIRKAVKYFTALDYHCTVFIFQFFLLGLCFYFLLTFCLKFSLVLVRFYRGFSFVFISSVIVLGFLIITVYGGHMPNIHFILNKHIKDLSDCNIKC